MWTKQLLVDSGKASNWVKFQVWAYEHTYYKLPYRVQRFWEDTDVFHPLRVYRKLANIVRWIPVLWHDTDWDYTSLYTIMYRKIKYMREHHTDHHNHEDWKVVVGQLQEVEEALARLIESNYMAEEHEAYSNNWPREPWIDLPDGMKQLPPLKPGQAEELRRLFEGEEALIQKDLETVARVFKEHVRGWWD